MISRDKSLSGKTIRIKTGCGWMYVTINFNKDNKPFEVFLNIGKAGGCASSQAEAIGRMASLLLRNNIPLRKIKKQLRDISCHIPIHEGAKSCSDAIVKALEEVESESKDS